jgi:hypothetical protein
MHLDVELLNHIIEGRIKLRHVQIKINVIK